MRASHSAIFYLFMIGTLLQSISSTLDPSGLPESVPLTRLQEKKKVLTQDRIHHIQSKNDHDNKAKEKNRNVLSQWIHGLKRDHHQRQVTRYDNAIRGVNRELAQNRDKEQQ